MDRDAKRGLPVINLSARPLARSGGIAFDSKRPAASMPPHAFVGPQTTARRGCPVQTHPSMNNVCT
jgi:hypothetical protein